MLDRPHHNMCGWGETSQLPRPLAGPSLRVLIKYGLAVSPVWCIFLLSLSRCRSLFGSPRSILHYCRMGSSFGL